MILIPTLYMHPQDNTEEHVFVWTWSFCHEVCKAFLSISYKRGWLEAIISFFFSVNHLGPLWNVSDLRFFTRPTHLTLVCNTLREKIASVFISFYKKLSIYISKWWILGVYYNRLYNQSSVLKRIKSEKGILNLLLIATLKLLVLLICWRQKERWAFTGLR